MLIGGALCNQAGSGPDGHGPWSPSSASSRTTFANCSARPRLGRLVDAAIARLGELLSLEPERQISSTAATADTTGDDGEHRDEHREAAALGLRVRDLTVGYEAGDPVLHGVSLDLPAGAQLALIGRTGSGKSTLARAIVRAVDVPEGHVFVDDRDVTGIALRDLRRSVALMSQRVELLDDTIEANITSSRSIDRRGARCRPDRVARLGRLDRRDRRARHATRTRRSATVGGEAQLVAFARLLARPRGDPRRTTARLDPVTEHRCRRQRLGSFADGTSVVIVHRLSTVRHADFVAVLDRGELVEFDGRAALEADPDSRFASAVRASADSEREVLELLDGGDDDGGDGQGDATDDGAVLRALSPNPIRSRSIPSAPNVSQHGSSLDADVSACGAERSGHSTSGPKPSRSPSGAASSAISNQAATPGSPSRRTARSWSASVLFAEFGERRFSLWWNFSNLTLRGQPHERPARSARCRHGPGRPQPGRGDRGLRTATR